MEYLEQGPAEGGEEAQRSHLSETTTIDVNRFSAFILCADCVLLLNPVLDFNCALIAASPHWPLPGFPARSRQRFWLARTSIKGRFASGKWRELSSLAGTQR